MRLFDKEQKNRYVDIERGTSFTLPVFLKDENNNPIISSDFQIYFTLKKNKFDFDYDDEQALIKKDAVLGDEKTGRYDINLSSRDTWLPPGEYYFDIMLKKGDDIYRLYCAETAITEAPSNRYQSDITSGGLFSEPISIGTYQLKPIHVELPGTFLLNYKDIPLKASPKYLLKEQSDEKCKEIQHFTSRMRFPLILEGEGGFVLNTISPYDFINENPFGKIKINLENDNITIWSIPLRSQIKFYGRDSIKEIDVGQSLPVSLQEDFIFHIKFENHLLIISGRRYSGEMPIMIEWFDFNE